jgi:hypothetical protein
MVLFFACFLGRLTKALIYKAQAGVLRRCPQSYPQKTWMTYKTAPNQSLRAFSASSLEQISPN